ncbi:small subunit ribosomal protein S9 [Vigna unguiculata]|uniref:Small subunit ribosomal protein S9 n=1 Tax=Vigna unguiculata TaxID=3917 RepID=A0A4D6MRH0_VIGUN|nr:small subunit ribosomal protein S9 [Vigna unguiculata]
MSNTLSFTTTLPKNSFLVDSVIAFAEPEIEDLKKFINSRVPGGFTMQAIIKTDRRKSAIARVILQEGTCKFINNYCDAKKVLLGLIKVF